ncbi:MAG: cyanophycin synthetase [Glaciecola sp.]|jgi:cyanophycin synthetase
MATETDRLVELRVLDGPNVHLTGPTIQLRLDVSHVLDADLATAQAWGTHVGLKEPISPGEVRSASRLAFSQRVAKRLVRVLSERTGVTRLRVETRPGWEDTEIMVAFPWRRLGPAEELGRWTAYLLEDLADLGVKDGVVTAADAWEELLIKACGRIEQAEDGEHAHVPVPTVPAVGVTGTNGKTTTTRLIAHLAMTAGHRTAWNSTDGVYADGVLVEAGDYAGFGGSAQVLETEGIEFAVLEIARGGLLRRGMGVARLDVAVVTNVTADHLGLMGVHTLDQLAEVKAIAVRAVRRDGWAVLNAQDPRVLAMREVCTGSICVFSLDAEAPGVRDALRGGGRAVTVIDGYLVVLRSSGAPERIVAVKDVPATLAGLAQHNLANALAGAAAALCAGLSTQQVADGLRTFVPDPDANPGRLNVWRRNGVTIVVDIAHNEASYAALLTVCRGLCPSTGTVRAVVGAIGDRTTDIIEAIGEVAARGADEVVIAEKDKYLRDSDAADVTRAIQAGAARVGRGPFRVMPDELSALDAVIADAPSGDVIAFTVHEHLGDVNDRMRERGAEVATPAEIAVLAKGARRN